jgi:flagellar motor switch protein FliG
MPAATLERPGADQDSEVPQLNRLQKLAALLVMLGPESAAQILRHFEPQEIEPLTVEMAKFSYITQELQQES